MEKRELTVLFSDIRGFSQFSEHHSPEQVQQFLSQYFSTMNKIVSKVYQGSINRLIGDAMMAFWGAGSDCMDHAYLAVSAALAMQKAMWNWCFDSQKFPMSIGIGINTGEALVGDIGSDEFMDYTVIGDTVNTASRLEGRNKDCGTHILISESTFEKVKDRIQSRRIGWVTLKGKSKPIEAFEPLGLCSERKYLRS
jgi:adenylate cyclase